MNQEWINIIPIAKEKLNRERQYEYNGCRNCENQIEPLRSCEWMENGGNGTVNIICPRWKRRENE